MRKCCSAALEPKRIVSAVRKVAEGEDRSRNVVVFGKPEEDEENMDFKVELVLVCIIVLKFCHLTAIQFRFKLSNSLPASKHYST